MTALFERHAEQIAAVILEPVLQGAGGMYVYPPAAVRFLADLARAHGALVIFDEIATGLLAHRHGVGGRSGRRSCPTSCASARRSPAVT